MPAKVPRPAKKKRTQSDLRMASKHLFWGMRYLSERLQFVLRSANSKREDEFQGVLSAIHESFLIHARKMFEFLFETSKGVYEDDVIAQDYFPNPDQWRQIQPAPPPVISQMHGSVGKLLAHFTYSVVEHPEGRVTWKTSDIYVQIFEAFQIFLAEVDSSLLDDRIELLRADNPRIVICRPIYPPEARPPYQIACTRDLASGLELTSDG